MQRQHEPSFWESQDVSEMRMRLRLAIDSAHRGDEVTCAHFLGSAQFAAINAGWERYSEEYHAAAQECVTALEECRV